jgi:hypothetical protein
MDVVDSLGLPLDVARAIALEIDKWCGLVADALFGSS